VPSESAESEKKKKKSEKKRKSEAAEVGGAGEIEAPAPAAADTESTAEKKEKKVSAVYAARCPAYVLCPCAPMLPYPVSRTTSRGSNLCSFPISFFRRSTKKTRSRAANCGDWNDRAPVLYAYRYDI
jgi:hypothetical protein